MKRFLFICLFESHISYYLASSTAYGVNDITFFRLQKEHWEHKLLPT